MNHFLTERDANGLPVRLIWSPDVQKAGDEWMEREKQERLEAKRMREKPMASLVEWAEKRGVWK